MPDEIHQVLLDGQKNLFSRINRTEKLVLLLLFVQLVEHGPWLLQLLGIVKVAGAAG